MAGFTMKVSPDTMIRQADAIKSTVSVIRIHLDNIEKRVTGSQTYWEGKASNLHQSSYTEIKKQGELVLRRLSEHPDDLLKMAGLYTETETQQTEGAASLPDNIFK